MPKKTIESPAELPLSIISGKWKTTILFLLRKEPIRSGKLKAQLPGITGAAFSNAIHDLEAAEVIKRKSKPAAPPEISYSITERGETLLPLIRLLAAWGLDHQAEFGIRNYSLGHLHKK